MKEAPAIAIHLLAKAVLNFTHHYIFGTLLVFNFQAWTLPLNVKC